MILAPSTPVGLSNEQILPGLVGTLPDAIIVIDEKSIIRWTNHVAEQVFGYPGADMVGRNVTMLMPSPYREAHDSQVERATRTGEAKVVGIGRVLFGQRSDGSVFPMELNVGQFMFEGRRLFSGLVRDLSKAHTAERRMQDLQSAFTRSVQLGGSQRLVASLAHELNQPTAAALNYTEVARELIRSGAAEERREADRTLGKAVAQLGRADQTLRRLRDILTRSLPERHAEDLNGIVVEATALALGSWRQRDVPVFSDFDNDIPPVLVDKAAIQEVIYHLMRNALEAMGATVRPRIVIETSVHPERAEAMVVIADTGPGLPPELGLEGDPPVGSSLAVCREIIESHGGRLRTSSASGAGTRAHFTLPIAAQA